MAANFGGVKMEKNVGGHHHHFEGPAPRPLDRFKVVVGDDGQLVVDKSKVFKMAPGVEPDEQYSDSVLKV